MEIVYQNFDYKKYYYIMIIPLIVNITNIIYYPNEELYFIPIDRRTLKLSPCKIKYFKG